MDFSAFDAKKMDEYVAQAKLAWGKTEAYKEYEQRAENISDKEKQQLADELMGFFKEFGQLVDKAPGDAVVQKQVEKLQNYITDNFYTCTNAILRALGKMYSGGGTITENIDAAGGKGTAEFVTKAIEIFCTGK